MLLADHLPPDDDFQTPHGHLVLGLSACNEMTLTECNLLCQHHRYYAVSGSSQCVCGDDSWTPKYKKVLDSQCNSPCIGDPREMCGGNLHNSVYSTESTTTQLQAGKCYSAVQRAKVLKSGIKLVGQSSSNAGPGQYLGCFKDKPHPKREMKYMTYRKDMTPTVCSKMCEDYTYYGLQAYDQCYCAGSDWASSFGKTDSDDGKECSNPCAGDHEQLCGGLTAQALSVYRQPLNCLSPHECTATTLEHLEADIGVKSKIKTVTHTDANTGENILGGTGPNVRPDSHKYLWLGLGVIAIGAGWWYYNMKSQADAEYTYNAVNPDDL